MKELLSCAMDIGEQMLICGAEVHRVEDSIQRMCLARGARRIDVFIITSSMVATVYTEAGDTYTQTRRITSTGTDIERLHRLNALSRKICCEAMTAEQIRDEYQKILGCKKYPFGLECLFCAIITGSFTLFFGGNFVEAGVSFVLGVCIQLLVTFTEKAGMNKIFIKFICSFLASSLAFLAVKLGMIPDIDKVIIGNIMMLIPGVGLTNALRDLFTGDSIAGLLRLIEALLVALAIGGGYFLFVCTVGGL
ncbi:MAG: threonine/serine exporter family protein [Clostridia bacterium]|nr:threonine/serine exporter family protein [Clostridia bacterium]